MAIRYKNLLDLSRNCIYLVVCHNAKRFMIGHTNNLLVALSRLSMDLENPKYYTLRSDIDEVDVEVLEEGVQDLHTRKIRVRMYTEKYLDMGYQQYIPSNYVRYSLHKDILEIGNHFYFCVYLKDTRKRKVLVGLFKDRKDMNKFVSEYYKDNKVSQIYYSNNSYTRRYLEKKGYGIPS